mmetsp:Transcript_31055/g.96075  ORF Transcript_31055/g.96075 Transcript_31055/m.96075 type:complete len:101 (-) Transcript_31055:797-1099(-)
MPSVIALSNDHCMGLTYSPPHQSPEGHYDGGVAPAATSRASKFECCSESSTIATGVEQARDMKPIPNCPQWFLPQRKIWFTPTSAAQCQRPHASRRIGVV